MNQTVSQTSSQLANQKIHLSISPLFSLSITSNGLMNPFVRWSLNLSVGQFFTQTDSGPMYQLINWSLSQFARWTVNPSANRLISWPINHLVN